MAERWRLVVSFPACTGLRIGELAALHVVDLNLAAMEVRVRGTAVGVSKNVFGEGPAPTGASPENHCGERTVPTITDEVADRLGQHIAERGLDLRDLLFTGRRGGPMMPDNWSRRIWDTAVGRALVGRSTAYASFAQAHCCRAVDWSRGGQANRGAVGGTH
jgi:integrase